jgi:hypothetical protein
MTPRTIALAYRIWAYAAPRGWDVTIPELADEMREHHNTITNILRWRGWLHRVRRVSGHGVFGGPMKNYQRIGRGSVDGGFDDGSVGI